jgi:hypothetical protein
MDIDHRADGDGGYAFVRELRTFLTSLDSRGRNDLRHVLLGLVIDRDANLWGVALEVLIQEGASEIAPVLEREVRTKAQPIEWQDQVVLALLRIGWKGGADIYRSYVRAALKENRRAILPILAALCRVDPQVCLEIASGYFADKLSEEDQAKKIERYIPAFVRNFVEVAPDLLVGLVRRTKTLQKPAAERLASMINEYLSKPFIVTEIGEQMSQQIIREILASLE